MRCLVLMTLLALSMAVPNVYIAYTGGTIGMKKTPDGWAPESGYLEARMAEIPMFSQEGMPNYTVHEFNPLLDSSNMEPSDWVSIANDIYDNYDKYDGFIVVHGTDTLVYTASALSYLLKHLNKTVIVTGAQIPMCEAWNDAVRNMVGSLMIAGYYSIPEVVVFFGDVINRGNRVQKVSAWDFGAFAAGNYPQLGKYGLEVSLNDPYILPRPTAPLAPVANMSSGIVHLELFPGLTAQYVKNILSGDVKGVVMDAFGTGNGPDANTEFLDVLSAAIKNGIVVVDVTQCHTGIVNLHEYATGSAFGKIGVVEGWDMAPEAAYAKMCYLFGTGLSSTEVAAKMPLSIRGELTNPNDPTIYYNIQVTNDNQKN